MIFANIYHYFTEWVSSLWPWRLCENNMTELPRSSQGAYLQHLTLQRNWLKMCIYEQPWFYSDVKPVKLPPPVYLLTLGWMLVLGVIPVQTLIVGDLSSPSALSCLFFCLPSFFLFIAPKHKTRRRGCLNQTAATERAAEEQEKKRKAFL